MHVIQYIATEADDRDHAFRSVKDYLESLMGNDFESPTNTWYDWFVTGGGRWSTSGDPYNNDYQADVAHQDSPNFEEYLLTAHKFKLEATAAELEYARKVDVAALLDKIENDQEGVYPMYNEATKLYPFKKLYEQVSGVWGPDSYFFDIHHDSTNMIHMKESIDKGSKNWYIVPVDFHF
jgi:hypothetical protein